MLSKEVYLQCSVETSDVNDAWTQRVNKPIILVVFLSVVKTVWLVIVCAAGKTADSEDNDNCNGAQSEVGLYGCASH